MSNSRHKFRAWDKKLNTFFPPDGDTWHFSIIGETTMFDLLNQYSIEDYNNLIIEQFTGLQDKNGKDIFEGDLIRVCSDYDYECEVVVYKENKFILEPLGDDWIYWEKSEIIGNIHENPELMGER